MATSSLLKRGLALIDFPAAAPPPGVKPNFVNPPTLVKSIVVINAVCLSLMIVVVSIQYASKRLITRQKYGWSDITCLVAILGSVTHTCLTINATTLGFGRHQYDIRALDMMTSRPMKISSIDIAYVVTTCFVKISLLLLFWQLFHIAISARRTIIFGLAIVTVLNIPQLTVSCVRVAICHGLEVLTTLICHQHAISITNIVFGIFNVLTDFFILTIPISQISKLKIPTQRKIGVMLSFLTGFIACSMSIVRLGVVAKDFSSTDTLWTAAIVARFSTIEMNLAIICSCVIYFPAFFKQSKISLSSAYMSVTRRSGRGSKNSSKSDPSSRHFEDTLRHGVSPGKSAQSHAVELENLDSESSRSR